MVGEQLLVPLLRGEFLIEETTERCGGESENEDQDGGQVRAGVSEVVSGCSEEGERVAEGLRRLLLRKPEGDEGRVHA